jgi:hypothetical protein
VRSVAAWSTARADASERQHFGSSSSTRFVTFIQLNGSGITRGVPTSYAAPPLKAQFAQGDLPPVWPHPEGSARGEGLAPLYKSAPSAAMRDPHLYEWLALVDAIRAGRARERKLATREVERRLSA